MKRRSPTYELKFGLIGFAVGLSAVAGVALAHNYQQHARLSFNAPSHAASTWSIEAR